MTDTQAFISDHRNDSDAELAEALVRHAGQLALRMRAQGVGTDYKTSISDVVTDADRAAEAFVAEVLEALRGDDGVLGEEGASRASQTGRTWVIDPVDGTYNFSQGSGYFCSALALVDDASARTPAIGAVHRPATDTTWLAVDGTATRDGVELGMLPEASLSESALVTYLHPTDMAVDARREVWLKPVREAATIRMMGAGSVDLANIASGQMGAWLQHSVADWDWLPGKALVEAVGGRAEKVDAGGVTWCVAGNPRMVADVIAALES
ncbi:inositol monophosphatase family protein [Corynebacterium fournieri]|uniref:inositol monophosphatase family protein n=2 Tax=Corynebacterium fournieri TaxID=1852390 RepID=UPI0025B36C84|nr:inositol monophosphatase family protein [Corynebacterium fournieri]WJY97013.1 Inositol-1-monophosphatase [Corynebacterium fournieri]